MISLNVIFTDFKGNQRLQQMMQMMGNERQARVFATDERYDRTWFS